jgi:putative membrane protein
MLEIWEPGGDVQPDSREYLAAERTLLAYIRTGLSMMGFGFVVARFSLFLAELVALRADAITAPRGVSIWFGTLLVFSGVLVNLISSFEYRRFVRKLNEQNRANWPVAWLPITTAVLLSLVGIAMAIYLLWLK